MGARFRLWWQKTEKSVKVFGIIMVLIAGIVLIYIVVRSYGTGFDGSTQISTSTDIAPAPHKITRIEVYQPGKALWDWLQLLIIPFVLAVGGYVFNLTVSKNERKAAANRDQTERDIAADNQREDTLQAYIDKMSELLLHEKLRDSTEDDEVRKIARVQTLTVLPRLDSVRKRSVLQFLYESGLIKKDKTIVDLNGANLSFTILSSANLSSADLSGADLSGTNLNEADLWYANLSKANLSFTILSSADLSEAHLSGANLSGAVLVYANLSSADLSSADLSEANLSGADLNEACLSGANLSGADLNKADLIHVNLSGAKNVTIKQLDRAKSLQKTTMPDGLTHP